MRYSYEFKLKCVELYKQGIWMETPEGISTSRFRDKINEWKRIEDSCGPEALKPKKQNKIWTAEERYELVAQVLAGNSIMSIAIKAGINSGMLYQWVQKYKNEGYNGLGKLQKGRPLSAKTMKKKTVNPRPLTESELEELIRLRAENAAIKAENEVIKKEIALREEKQAALLKAKKQRSLKNSESKDSN